MFKFYLTLPLAFLIFWFWEAPLGILSYFASLNSAFLQLFSLPLLVKTYFKPWKSEYREGLVEFSIAMGMFIKTFVIAADLILFIFLILVELVLLLLFLFIPVGVLFLLLK
ncbi:MAG: hypothetical protein HYT83_03750 [Candidatus Levybacteria bacterium]|nr:hypothetical protein [Candidatus Levybacteria bacterium]